MGCHLSAFVIGACLNASDPKQVEKSARREKLRRERELRDVSVILSTREGRRYLWELLAQCRVFQTIWEPSARIHFLEGQRNIGLKVLADINDADPTAYVTMLSESKKEVSDE